MLNDIFKSIDEKVREEIGKITQEKEEALLALENNYKAELAKRQQLARELLQKKADREIDEQQKKLELEARFSVQEAKHQMMEDVYQKALAKLSQLSDGELKKILTKLVRTLPRGLEGKVRAGKRTAPLLKHLLDRKSV
ncbi:MAG: hypothetical protein PHN39_02915, partial [Candidatus Pacebacteria bacterium]|nr:hypothetical protein [Candidatus Paceibacterota bacterium]